MNVKIEISGDDYDAHCNDNDGICLACGEWTCGGVEPDASNYKCEMCDSTSVMGCEEALMQGYLDFTNDSTASP